MNPHAPHGRGPAQHTPEDADQHHDPTADITDAALVDRARGGDFQAFATLVSRYENRIYALALNLLHHEHDAEEVVQETFLRALDRLDTFRGDAAFATWLIRIATNTARSRLRQRNRERLVEPDADWEQTATALATPEVIAPWQATPDRLLEDAETARVLREALDALPVPLRAVFWLRDVEGLSTTQTARALELSESNVKVRLMRARLLLREALTRVFGDDAQRLAPHTHNELPAHPQGETP